MRRYHLRLSHYHFVVTEDAIQLENAIFTKLTVTDIVNSNNFKIGPVAADVNDYLVYNNTSGALLYDADGNGAGVAVQIATLGANLALTNANFLVA